MIMTTVNRGTDVPADSRREILMGYQYTLHQRRKKLREERDMFMRSRGDDSMSSEEHWNEYSDASESGMERNKDPKHKRRTTTRVVEESYTKEPKHEPTRGGGRIHVRNSRSSIDCSIGISTNHACKTL
jgi:hypothetical protein